VAKAALWAAARRDTRKLVKFRLVLLGGIGNIRPMTSKAISNAFDLLEGCNLVGPDVPSPAAGTRRLDGHYRLTVAGGGVEIECLDTASLWRSAIYVAPGVDVVLRMPRSEYRFWLRPLGAGAPTQVLMSPMGLTARAAFALAKTRDVLARGEALTVARQVIRGWFAARVPGAVGAARAPGAHRPATVAIAPRRPPLALPPPPAGDLGVSVVIPTKERVDLLKACVDSVRPALAATDELIIVDNGATAPAMLACLADLARDNVVRVLRRDIPFNFSRLCNDGARLARNPLLLFLNDDVEAMDGQWLAALRAFAGQADIGVVGARLLYPSGGLQHGGIATNLIPGPGHPWRGVGREVWQDHPLLANAGEVDAVTGACLMIRKAIFDRVGGFDETDFAITLNDVDLCLRVRALGFRIIYAPQATLWHKEGQTRDADRTPNEIQRYRRELALFYKRHEDASRTSVFYPVELRRDTDAGLPP